jgi:hypothetical protein
MMADRVEGGCGNRAFSVHKKSILFEKWQLRTGHQSIGESNTIGEPACMQSIEITQTEITDGPLLLEFYKVFLRPSTPPPETDLIFTVQELKDIAEMCFDLS